MQAANRNTLENSREHYQREVIGYKKEIVITLNDGTVEVRSITGEFKVSALIMAMIMRHKIAKVDGVINVDIKEGYTTILGN